MTNEIKYIDFDSICRLCLEKYNGDQEFIPIFLHHNYGERHGKKFKETIIDIINSFTSLLVDPSDGLPIHICFHCSEKLCDTHTFKQKCIESIQLLNEIKARHLDNKLTFESDDYDSEDNAPLNRFKRPELIIVDVVKQIPNLNNELIGVGDLNLKITENNNIQVHQHQENLENNKHLSSDCSASIIYRSGNDEQFQTSAQLLDSIPKLQPFQPQSSSTSTQPKKSRKKPRCNLLKQCNFCGVIVKSLRDHMRTHPGQLPYKCNLCKRPYITKLGLNRHMDIQHGIHSDDDNRNQNVEMTTTSAGNNTNNILNDNNNVHKTKQMKRKQRPHLWECNVKKSLRNCGEAYISNKGKVMPAKALREPCGLNCKFKCILKITHAQRQEIFKYFWSMGNLKKQREFIGNNIEKILPKYGRRSRTQSDKCQRGLNIAYSFEISLNGTLPTHAISTSTVTNVTDAATESILKKQKIRVCKLFFVSTLNISDKWIITVMKMLSTGTGCIRDDKRGKHKKWNIVTNDGK